MRAFFRQRIQFILIINFLILGIQFLSSHEPFQLRASKPDKFIVVTPQKCGTHLLTKALRIILNKNVIHFWGDDLPSSDLISLLQKAEEQNAFLHTHAYPNKHIIDTLESLNYKVIFLMRDPRDQAISLFYWIRNINWPYAFDDKQHTLNDLSDEELLDEIITGERRGVSYTKKLIGERMAWSDYHLSFTTHFESLVGEKGGGSFSLQCHELATILSFLNVEWDDHMIENCAERLFGRRGEGTFRSGKIGSWKKHFTNNHIHAFKLHFGDEMIQLGYEKDYNW